MEASRYLGSLAVSPITFISFSTLESISAASSALSKAEKSTTLPVFFLGDMLAAACHPGPKMITHACSCALWNLHTC